MDSALRSVVHDLVIGGSSRANRPDTWRRGAREILTQDIREAIEGTYGVHSDGRVEPEERLPHLADDPEAAETYRRIRSFLDNERGAGIAPADAVDKLVREAAFTHLNRLVAFKMLEARGLIRGTLARYPRPNGFIHYLAGHPDDEARYSSGQEDLAYRNFLLWQAGEIAAEVRVLFDPDSLASRLFPRPASLRDLIEMLNHEDVAAAWTEDETIGWVYQYFNEKEKADVFDRLYKQKQKIRREDIPAATQLFTPRWIVEFLVQNTLGRTWLQMHPHSRLAEQMEYLVPLAGEIPAEELKPVREITVLDPACGTMHFGLVAFDLLAEMYREELRYAGQPGWPETPSVATEEEIPAAIVAHNLYGIDIDLRAVQLAALTLYLKAKSLNREARITASNLVSADVLPFRQSDLDTFLAEMQFTRPIYERVLRALWPRLAEVSELGSLARLERDLAAVIEQERTSRSKEERENPLLVDIMGDFGPATSAEDQWRAVEDHILWSLDHYAKSAAERGADVTFFTGEATKGLRLLDVMRRRYDVVLSNPPYLTNFTDRMKTTLARNYPTAKSDTYAAFIVRCVEWLQPQGRVGMITQQSFMFLSTYEHLRKSLIGETAIEAMAHTGPRAFEEIDGQKVNTTVFTLRTSKGCNEQSALVGTYIRLTDAPDKLSALRLALSSNENTHTVSQARFQAIPGSPWVYWISNMVLRLFSTQPRLGDVASSRVGLQTSDNFRFLRFWWESGKDGITFGPACNNRTHSSRTRWVPHTKGGEYKRWYGNQSYVVNWGDDGKELRNFPPAVIRNPDYYFRDGITWTVLSSKGFAVRLLPSGSIIGHKGPGCFASTWKDLMALLGILNSTPTSALLGVISPALGYEVGHLQSLPLPHETSDDLFPLVNHAVACARVAECTLEEAYDFTAPLPWNTGIEDAARREAKLFEIERQIDDEVYRLYGISDEDRAAIEAELNGPAVDEDDVDGTDGEVEEPEPPITRQELAVRWVSYAAGIVMGRFQPGVEGALGSAIVRDLDSDETRHMFTPEVEEQLRGLADGDGILVLDPGHSDDIVARIEQALELMLGHDGLQEVVSEVGNLRKFMERDFFTKWHVRWYRKRPVYWLLQSPKRNYGIYLFHERITRDTLFVVQRRYVDPKLVALGHQIDELRARLDGVSGRERTQLQREYDNAVNAREDVIEFGRILRRITETGPGYDPDINDGVILNMAPLWEVLPIWKAEPKKYWDSLERGAYDWSHIAMRHWPERVMDACRTNKSFAIAHSRLDLYKEETADVAGA